MPIVVDQYQRPLHDLRLSVTDRCNFRCVYCMPKEVYGSRFHFLPKHDLLTFDELTRAVWLFAQLGVKKIRITGGEPLLRRDLDVLIHQISEVEGIEEIAMTTNGSGLDTQRAKTLQQAGLRRVTVSLDALTDKIFKAINDVGVPVSRILSAIDAAIAAGLHPIKVNMVLKRDVNDQQIIPMARHFRHTGVTLRFIEYMDVGNTNGWRMDDVVPASEILATLQQEWALEPVAPTHPGEVARRYRYQDGGGEIGIIASVTQPFCQACSRIRVSPEGQIYTCLFCSKGFDLRRLLREDSLGDEQVMQALKSLWAARDDQYSLNRSKATGSGPKVEMSHIGG